MTKKQFSEAALDEIMSGLAEDNEHDAYDAIRSLRQRVEALTEAGNALVASCSKTPNVHDDCGTRIITAPSVEALRAWDAALAQASEPSK